MADKKANQLPVNDTYKFDNSLRFVVSRDNGHLETLTSKSILPVEGQKIQTIAPYVGSKVSINGTIPGYMILNGGGNFGITVTEEFSIAAGEIHSVAYITPDFTGYIDSTTFTMAGTANIIGVPPPGVIAVLMPESGNFTIALVNLRDTPVTISESAEIQISYIAIYDNYLKFDR